jgi:hypothetical protein
MIPRIVRKIWHSILGTDLATPGIDLGVATVAPASFRGSAIHTLGAGEDIDAAAVVTASHFLRTVSCLVWLRVGCGRLW